ncbi:MAG TPA: phosphatase PAP2 family protein [Lachnospiraceae bacterium]|nr:phosphatase PAP2 family protein [Lachnospiraceae bacterium]
MNENIYCKLTEAVKKSRFGGTLVRLLDKLITIITGISYLVLLCYIYKYSRNLLYAEILVPGVSFVLVTIARDLLGARRPYEVYGFEPVIKKETVAHSFPSRHVFSIFMIAMAFMQVSPILGRNFLIFGLVLACIRVMGGVHFIKDVVAGALLGVLMGRLGFYLIF